MNELTELGSYQQQILMTTTFRGYNHRDIIDDGEMYDMTNMSGDRYPLFSTRKKRGITDMDVPDQDSVPLTGIHGRDQLVYVRGNTVYYNHLPVQGISLSTGSGTWPKQIVSFGAYVLIFPDKKYFNTADLTDAGNISRMWEAAGDDISMTMCRGDGTNYDMTEITSGETPPDNPADKALWLDESGENDVLRQYSALTDEWVEVPSTFVKISGTGIGTGLKQYDCIDISGLELAGEDPDAKLAAQVNALNTSSIIYFCGDDYIVVAGLLSQAIETDDLKDNTVHADLDIPDMDWMIESNNRLWGCKYGLSGGQVVNEIYASKLGDFRNFRCYMGLSTDSYTASVGTDGPFNGAIRQRGYPVFFKENAIHRVSGNTPSSFQIQTTVARGVQRGSGRSLAVVNENIYYKSRTGVMMYDGNMPVEISSQLGDELYFDARAGALGTKYYISMQDSYNVWHLFCYNTETGTWYREDNLQALGFGAAEDELYCIDEEHNTLVAMTGSMGTKETDIPWSATFGLFGTDYRAKKYLSRFDIRMDLEADHHAKLEIRYDEDERWTQHGEIRGRKMGTFVLPVIPRRCDHLQVRLSGTGEAKIYAISRVLEVGNDG